MLLNKHSLENGGVFEILKKYEKLFPSASKNREFYWKAINGFFQRLVGSSDLNSFLQAGATVVDECVQMTIDRIADRIDRVEKEERSRIELLDSALLREALINSEVTRKTSQDRRRLENIKRFRT
jgi:hypothetical protein